MLINRTPFKLIPQPSQVSPPAHALTIIVKGTFDMRNGEVSTLADEQMDFAPDEPYLDEIGRSLAWADDFVPFKPHTDFYIHGAFHQPDGQPAPTGTASFEFGPLKKSLVFHGPRLATIRNGSWTIGPTKPVVSIPLRWEYSFGGMLYQPNPYGRGIDPISEVNGETVVELPLIEHPDHPIHLPTDRPAPANFAPVPKHFAARLRKHGTQDLRWSLFRAPLPPLDYDPSFNNAAPDDQQGGNYPRGDEVLILRNLHPKIALLRTRLPGLRPRVGILRIKGDIPKDPAKIAEYNQWDVTADEVMMNLDTVVVLPESDKLVLLWRGVQPMRQAHLPFELAWLQCELHELNKPLRPFAEIEAEMRRQYQELAPPPKSEQEKLDQELAKQAQDRLAELKLPDELMNFVRSEQDPRKVFDRLISYVNDEARALAKKFGLPNP